jgi:hypothetical protein
MRKYFMLSLSVVLGAMLHAQNVFLVEHFNYTPGTTLQSNGWNTHSAGTTNPIQVSNGGLAWTQTPYIGSGIGNAAAVNNNGSDENRPLSSFVDSGSVYVSFLMRVNGAVTTTNAGFFFHIGEYANVANPVFTSISTAFRARTFIATGSSADKYRLGLAFNASAVPSAPAELTSELDTGATYLVVVKYQFVPGTLNDLVSLYVFADGANIATEPATPAIGPLTGTAADLAVAQYVALRQYNAGQNITVDGIIVQDAWQMVLPLVAPTLVSPPNNTQLVVNGPAATPVNITWTAAQNTTVAPTYEWQLAARATGNFNPPLLALPSNNSGADTVLSLNFGAIDGVLAGLGVNVGDTVFAQWRVRAIAGGDTLISNVFDIDIVRGFMVAPLTNFSLVSPPDLTVLTVGPNSTGNAVISWTRSTAGTQPVTYEWLAILPGGNFGTPVVNLAADNAGADTTLTLPLSNVDALLASLGVNRGDSVDLDWTVIAMVDTTGILANQVWRIRLIRESNVSVGAEINGLQNLAVFPNPAETFVDVKVVGGYVGRMQIEMVDLNGKILMAGTFLQTATNVPRLNISSLPAGNYIVRVTHGNELSFSRLSVK